MARPYVDYDDGGKVYVAEEVLRRAGWDGGVISGAEEAQRLADQAAATLGGPRVRVHLGAPGDPWSRLDRHALGVSIRGGSGPDGKPANHIELNRQRRISRLVVLHEVAHAAGPPTERHGRDWQEQAARLYGTYLSPQAETEFRDLMGLQLGEERRRRHASRPALARAARRRLRG